MTSARGYLANTSIPHIYLMEERYIVAGTVQHPLTSHGWRVKLISTPHMTNMQHGDHGHCVEWSPFRGPFCSIVLCCVMWYCVVSCYVVL